MLDMEQQYDNIYRYCYFKLRHAQTAEDITQETFLRYWDRYHPMPNALAIRYLYIIAKNLCIDEYRRQNSVPLEETILQPSEEEQIRIDTLDKFFGFISYIGNGVHQKLSAGAIVFDILLSQTDRSLGAVGNHNDILKLFQMGDQV